MLTPGAPDMPNWPAASVRNAAGSPLVQIWVRKPTDLFHRNVPIFIYKLPGSGANLQHIAQTPPGVTIETKLDMPRGWAFCLYADGTYQKFEGRRMAMMRQGKDLVRS